MAKYESPKSFYALAENPNQIAEVMEAVKNAKTLAELEKSLKQQSNYVLLTQEKLEEIEGTRVLIEIALRRYDNPEVKIIGPIGNMSTLQFGGESAASQYDTKTEMLAVKNELYICLARLKHLAEQLPHDTKNEPYDVIEEREKRGLINRLFQNINPNLSRIRKILEIPEKPETDEGTKQEYKKIIKEIFTNDVSIFNLFGSIGIPKDNDDLENIVKAISNYNKQ